MNLFRSEEHASRWLGGRAPGVAVDVLTLSERARAWYADRVATDWRPRTRAQSQAILDEVGLTGDFWRLPG